MYGVPRASSAVCTTVAALPEIVAGGSGGGRSGGAPFPPAPLPLHSSPVRTTPRASRSRRRARQGVDSRTLSAPDLRADSEVRLPGLARSAAATRLRLP